ncbi:hypothetical protein U472_04010 [Orenia metallireducens]|uniref:Uncharacterized protein n=1 Tax=Orenia metallireducens TaxID=1413210 RepID=A0A1C0ABG4_9FIRM|nr:hypothetical protein [Orenia metallireducens]OCL27725.1 hypothetical protein U472_04010 [Orenia metallireducens]
MAVGIAIAGIMRDVSMIGLTYSIIESFPTLFLVIIGGTLGRGAIWSIEKWIDKKVEEDNEIINGGNINMLKNQFEFKIKGVIYMPGKYVLRNIFEAFLFPILLRFVWDKMIRC